MAAALVDKALKALTDINAVDYDGRTLLHLICYRSDPNAAAACTRILASEFGYRNNIDTTDRDGDTAFLAAAESGNLPVMKYLAEAKADVNAVNSHNASALNLVCRNGGEHVVPVIRWLAAQESGFDMQRFIETAPKSFLKIYPGTPFLSAAFNRNLPAMKVLANDCMANVNVISKYGRSALHVLCSYDIHGAVPAIRWLASQESGFNVQRFIEHKDAFGSTPFLLSCNNSDGLCVMKLLVEDLKANVNAVTHNGDSALHLACGKGNMPALRWLLAKDSPFDAKRFIEAKGFHGCTPFLAAARFSNLDAMKLLANDHKANVNAVDICRRSALDLALERTIMPCSSIMGWLAAKESGFNFHDFIDGSGGCTPLEREAFSGNFEVIRVLVESYKANVHKVNEDYGTILHYFLNRSRF